jgi:hypothetical protein
MNIPSPQVIETLKAGMRGPVILPNDPTYGENRLIWNAMIDKHPAAIAQCSGVADVMHAVRVAREAGLLGSVDIKRARSTPQRWQ